MLQIAVAVSLIGACGGEGAHCVIPPCPVPIAAEVTVRDSVSALPVATASITWTGPYPGYHGTCSGTWCSVVGGAAGTYTIEVSAPGYTSITRQFVVGESKTSGSCGCDGPATQKLTVALAPAE